MSRFREKINQSYCLAKGEKGWVVAKRVGKNIFVTDQNTGGIVSICTTTETDMYKYFNETLEYISRKTLSLGDTVRLDNYGPYYVVDSGYRGEDGKAKYLIGR